MIFLFYFAYVTEKKGGGEQCKNNELFAFLPVIMKPSLEYQKVEGEKREGRE